MLLHMVILLRSVNFEINTAFHIINSIARKFVCLKICSLFQSKIPFGELLTKNTYVGRTFIQPNNRLRQINVALKFSK